jgi:AraC-like DNA-binding protein
MQTVPKNHLTLQLIRLRRSEEWTAIGECLSFVLSKGGAGRCLLGQRTHDLAPGDLLVWNSTVGGKIVVTNGAMVFWNFSVCFDHLLPLFSIGEICLLRDLTEHLKVSKLYSASSQLAQECNKLVESAPPQGNFDHRSQLLRVAAAVLSIELQNASSQRVGFVRAEDHMLHVFDKLSIEELLTLSVSELAQKFSCSHRHLNRLFHQHFGFCVAALRMELRLLKALSLLRDPNLKVISVAEQCGFNHLGLFNTCFKKRFGDSPGRLRKADLQNHGHSIMAFNGGIFRKLSGQNLGLTAGETDLSAPIRAKVYEILKQSMPRDLLDPAGRAAGETNQFRARTQKNRPPGAEMRNESPR